MSVWICLNCSYAIFKDDHTCKKLSLYKMLLAFLSEAYFTLRALWSSISPFLLLRLHSSKIFLQLLPQLNMDSSVAIIIIQIFFLWVCKNLDLWKWTIIMYYKDTNRKIRKTEFIYICGSKNGSSSCTVNTGEVWGDVSRGQKALCMSEPKFKHSNLWKMLFLSFY